jgi:hypothetical protein
MNSKRAANRAGKSSGRYPEHHSPMPKGGNKSHMMHNSPASTGVRVGPGPIAGTDQMPAKGPGPAARSKRPAMTEDNTNVTPSGAAPKGMSVYDQE